MSSNFLLHIYHWSRDFGFCYISLKNNEFCSGGQLTWLTSTPNCVFPILGSKIFAQFFQFQAAAFCQAPVWSRGQPWYWVGIYTPVWGLILSRTLLFLGFPPASALALNFVFWYLHPVRLNCIDHWGTPLRRKATQDSSHPRSSCFSKSWLLPISVWFW